MNQNFKNMTFDTVDPEKLFNQSLQQLEATAVFLSTVQGGDFNFGDDVSRPVSVGTQLLRWGTGGLGLTGGVRAGTVMGGVAILRGSAIFWGSDCRHGDWVCDQLSVGRTMKIRELDPGSAWNEAERRAIPLGFVGFFLAGLVCVFGGGLGIREPFLSGICGAVGLFLAAIASSVGFYHNRLVLAFVAMILTAFLPTVATALLLPLTGNGRTAFVPSIALGVATYAVLHRMHWNLSGLTFARYVRQLADDQHGAPKAGWESKFVWILAGLGTLVILALLSKR